MVWIPRGMRLPTAAQIKQARKLAKAKRAFNRVKAKLINAAILGYKIQAMCHTDANYKYTNMKDYDKRNLYPYRIYINNGEDMKNGYMGTLIWQLKGDVPTGHHGTKYIDADQAMDAIRASFGPEAKDW